MHPEESIIRAGVRILRRGDTIGTWGNLSVRDPDTGYVYITPSGMDYESLTTEDIVVLTAEGEPVRRNRKPSVETPLHLAVYAARSDAMAIVHTHPIYSTALSSMGEDIPLFLDQAAQTLGDTVRTARWALSGTEELAQNCVEALGERSMACLLRAHGAVCLGESMEKALLCSDILEAAARILCLMRAMGGRAEPLDAGAVAKMQDFMKNSYGQR